MAVIPDDIAGLASLQAETMGRPEIVVAVVDGPVDVDHQVFRGAALESLPGESFLSADESDSTAAHGTHVASIIFGQPGTEVTGVAPAVTGLIVPIFERHRARVPQLEIARAIERCVEAGAHVINFSGGQYVDSGSADDWLERAVKLCEERNVLLVAAAGNDGCDCLHVPAALDAALAVGALGDNGEPLDLSNWGESYLDNGILAAGENLLGALPGGGVGTASGTSAAAPIVAGVAALLLSLQSLLGESPDPLSVRRAILDGAEPCVHTDPDACRRLLGGIFSIKGAQLAMTDESQTSELQTSDAGAGPSCGSSHGDLPHPDPGLAAAVRPMTPPAAMPTLDAASPSFATVSGTSISAGEEPVFDGAGQSAADDGVSLVYALGTLGYDFGTEARRDSFKQLMSPVVIDGQGVPANPHDTRQMVNHLDEYPSEAHALIWTLNLELTPLYAFEATGAFAADVYKTLRQLLGGEIEAPDSLEWVERVSIPGRLSGRSIRLFSGQVVPVVEIDTTRGLYGWRSNWLVSTAIDHAKMTMTDQDVSEDLVAGALAGFLNRVYYDMRNLGVLSRDRALNFAATNVFQAAAAFFEALAIGMQLDAIDVEPSPYARADADAWDVKLKFFDPENLRRARRVFRFTVDVSEIMPVTLGEVRSWSSTN